MGSEIQKTRPALVIQNDYSNRASPVFPRIPHRLNLLRGQLQVRPDLPLPPEGLSTRLCSDLRPILRDPLHPDQIHRAQHTQHLLEQLIQSRPMSHPEIRQRVVIDPLHPGQPLKRRLVVAPPRHLPGRGNPFAVGADPHADQQARVQSRLSGHPLDRANTGIESAQVQLAHELPDGPHRVGGRDQLLHIHNPPL